MNDLRFAFRQLLKNPGFTSVAVLTLALGVGATTAIFSVVNAVLLKPMPYEQPGQLVQLWEAPSPGKRNWVSPGAFTDWKEQSTAFENLSVLYNADSNITGTGEPERISGVSMSANGLQIFRARLVLGRTFTPDEDQPGKDKVIILTHRLWQRRFGGDSNIAGRTVGLDGQSYTIVGVLPPHFLPWDRPEFVIPHVISSEQKSNRGNHSLTVFGRLKPNVTVEQAQVELNALAARLKQLYPVSKKDWGVTVIPMNEQITGDIRPTLLLLLGAVGCVLLIACANVANLLLAKASARQKEIAVRAALGASRWRVIRQLLVESFLLSLLGALFGLLVAFWSAGALGRLTAVGFPRAHNISLDLHVLGFALCVSLLTGLVFGLIPALQASRPNLNDMLKEGARGSPAGTQNRIRNGLIVAEVALALVLLAGAGLLLNSFFHLINVPPGFNPHHVLTMQMTLPNNKYPDRERSTKFFTSVVERLETLPGVEAAGLSTTLALAGGRHDTLITIKGRPDPLSDGHPADFEFCSPDYFLTMRIPLLRGRVFDRHDTANSPRVVVVNEAFVRGYFRDEDPLGKYINDGSESWEIVGVVGNVHNSSLAELVPPRYYCPQAFNYFGYGYLVVRTSGAPLALTDSVRHAILEIDPDQPVSDIRTLEDVLGSSVVQRRLILLMLGGFAGAALSLAAIGLYGVIAYGVSQRTREIGIRMSLGADSRNVLGVVLRHGLKLAGLGIAIGVPAALGLTRVLMTLLFEVKPTDPLTFIGVSFLLLLVALFASWLPARRASKVDPMEALRYE